MLLNRKSKINRALKIFYIKKDCIYNKNDLDSGDLKVSSSMKPNFLTASFGDYKNSGKSLDNHQRVMLVFGHIAGKGENGPFTVGSLGLVVAKQKWRWSLPLNGPK
jgi:SLT domain-containing protein